MCAGAAPRRGPVGRRASRRPWALRSGGCDALTRLCSTRRGARASSTYMYARVTCLWCAAAQCSARIRAHTTLPRAPPRSSPNQRLVPHVHQADPTTTRVPGFAADEAGSADVRSDMREPHLIVPRHGTTSGAPRRRGVLCPFAHPRARSSSATPPPKVPRGSRRRTRKRAPLQARRSTLPKLWGKLSMHLHGRLTRDSSAPPRHTVCTPYCKVV